MLSEIEMLMVGVYLPKGEAAGGRLGRVCHEPVDRSPGTPPGRSQPRPLRFTLSSAQPSVDLPALFLRCPPWRRGCTSHGLVLTAQCVPIRFNPGQVNSGTSHWARQTDLTDKLPGSGRTQQHSDCPIHADVSCWTTCIPISLQGRSSEKSSV